MPFMRGIWLVLGLLVLAGCIGTTEEATPTPEPTATPSPTVVSTATPTPTPEPTASPETHECMEIADGFANNNVKASKIRDCFFEKEEYVECTYYMMKEAREDELETNLVGSWPQAMYAKAVQCAKEAEKLPDADKLPEKLSINILYYYDCYNNVQSICSTTAEEIDQMIVDLSLLI